MPENPPSESDERSSSTPRRADVAADDSSSSRSPDHDTDAAAGRGTGDEFEADAGTDAPLSPTDDPVYPTFDDPVDSPLDDPVYPTFDDPTDRSSDPAEPTTDSSGSVADSSDTPQIGMDAPPTDDPAVPPSEEASDVPPDVRKYDRFKKIEGGTYDRANEFLRDRTYVTAREWAIARLCADFRTETGVEMTKIGENLPELVPFMTDTYTPQAVNQARHSFEEKVRKAGATFLYGAMCDFFTAEQLDDVMYEATEVAKFLLEVEGVELSVEEELEAEDRISEVMREVREHSAALRHDECPHCGGQLEGEDDGGDGDGSAVEADD